MRNFCDEFESNVVFLPFRLYPRAVKCMMEAINECVDPQADLLGIWELITLFQEHCESMVFLF